MDITERVYEGLLNLAIFATGAVILVLILIVRARISKWFKNHFVKETLENDVKIKEILVEIRVEVNADRVSLFLFHNGERYINGNSILRLSGAYECLANGIGSHKESSQNILVSTVPEAVSFLVNDPFEKVQFDKVEELEECYYQAVLISQGVRSVAKYPIRKGNDIIGFISADFVQTEGPAKDKIKIIKEKASQVELHVNSSRRKGFKRFLAKILGGK